jgi:hypothetical protein
VSQSDYVHLEDCNIVAETDAAILIEYEGDRHWFPRSHVADADDCKPGEKGRTVSVSGWIARQKGIEVE